MSQTRRIIDSTLGVRTSDALSDMQFPPGAIATPKRLKPLRAVTAAADFNASVEQLESHIGPPVPEPPSEEETNPMESGDSVLGAEERGPPMAVPPPVPASARFVHGRYGTYDIRPREHTIDGIPEATSYVSMTGVTIGGVDVVSRSPSVLSPRECYTKEFPIPIKTGVLAKRMIGRLRDAKRIRIEPFFEDQLTNVAYDVRLGENFFVENTDVPGIVVDVSSKTSVRKSWKQGKPIVIDGQRGILLGPGEMAIGHTLEFIGSMPGNPITTLLRGRSSMIRSGITISASGCWGDIGYNNRWGLVLKNTRSATPVFIPFGVRIAQIVFLTTTNTTDDESYETKGAYAHQNAKDASACYEDLLAKWSPSSLL